MAAGLVKLEAPAKINLYLEVLGRREDIVVGGESDCLAHRHLTISRRGYFRPPRADLAAAEEDKGLPSVLSPFLLLPGLATATA